MRAPGWLCALCFALACDADDANPGSDAGPSADGSDAQGSDASEPDAGGGPITPITAQACFADLTEPDWGRLEVQRFRNAERNLELWRARQSIDEPTIGETSAYALVRFWIQREGDGGTCIRAAEDLDYDYAHHNWNETWRADAGDVIYTGTELFTPENESDRWTDTLTATNDAGDVLWGPVDLQDDGCSSLPYDLNVCMSRTRIDEPPPGWGEE